MPNHMISKHKVHEMVAISFHHFSLTKKPKYLYKVNFLQYACRGEFQLQILNDPRL